MEGALAGQEPRPGVSTSDRDLEGREAAQSAGGGGGWVAEAGEGVVAGRECTEEAEDAPRKVG